jgi:endonuclease/exonuclease/phosphatase (EEP) superfamily protein YafD
LIAGVLGCVGAAAGLAPWLGTWSWPGDLLASFASPLAWSLGIAALAFAPRRRSVIILPAVVGLVGGTAAWIDASARAPLDPAATGPAIKLLVLNAWSQNPNPQAVLDTLTRESPDIAVIMECPPDLVTAATGGTGPFAAYPSRERRYPAEPRNAWALVMSRWPMKLLDVPDAPWSKEENPFPVLTQVQTPAGPVAVVGMQASSPRSLDRWHAGNITADRSVLAARAAMTAGLPVIVAGDLNSAPTAGRDQIMRRGGLVRCKPATRLEGTYPVALPWPLQLAIDDAWVGPGVAVRSWRRLTQTGSDHAGIMIELVLPAAKPG